MAKIITTDNTRRSGKMSKKDDAIYRTRNGKTHSYTQTKNTNPASKAQNAHRKLFGKTTTLVNKIIADPEQLAEWTQRMKDHNRSLPFDQTHKQYKTVHQYIFAVIKEQLEKQEAKKRKRNPIKKALPKGFKMIIKPFAELSTTELYEILKARFAVFYMEQHCYYQDMDNVDYLATHIALQHKGRIIAYARLFQDAKPGTWHIGRMLTIDRKKGYGKLIMDQIEQEALKQGATTLLLHAQTHAIPFYEKCGFTTVGELFTEADMPHISMEKAL
jgi:ElaA protein